MCLNNSRIDGLVQERRNSSALAMELRLSCTNLSVYSGMNNIDVFYLQPYLHIYGQETGRTQQGAHIDTHSYHISYII